MSHYAKLRTSIYNEEMIHDKWHNFRCTKNSSCRSLLRYFFFVCIIYVNVCDKYARYPRAFFYVKKSHKKCFHPRCLRLWEPFYHSHFDRCEICVYTNLIYSRNTRFYGVMGYATWDYVVILTYYNVRGQNIE